VTTKKTEREGGVAVRRAGLSHTFLKKKGWVGFFLFSMMVWKGVLAIASDTLRRALFLVL
jgi:hypothetical protein